MLPFCANPVLKWAGGKQGIADQLLRFFPTDFERYFEPFVGGGSVLFALYPAKAVIGDHLILPELSLVGVQSTADGSAIVPGRAAGPEGRAP